MYSSVAKLKYGFVELVSMYIIFFLPRVLHKIYTRAARQGHRYYIFYSRFLSYALVF